MDTSLENIDQYINTFPNEVQVLLEQGIDPSNIHTHNFDP